MNYLVDCFYTGHFTWDAFKKGISIPRPNLFLKLDPLKSEPLLHIWMLLFGYYTISSYDKESDRVVLTLANEEIEQALEYNLERYIPNKNGFIHLDFAIDLEHFKNATLIRNTEKAMEILSNFAFPSYEHPLNLEASTREAVRRVGLFFRSAGINISLCEKFNKDEEPNFQGGDVDMQTYNLDENYVLEIKVTTNKLDTLPLQL